jgi:hypothetical protein
VDELANPLIFRVRVYTDDDIDSLRRRNNPVLAAWLEDKRAVIEVRVGGRWQVYGAESSRAVANQRLDALENPERYAEPGRHRLPEHEQGDRRADAGKGGHYDVTSQIGERGAVLREGMLTDPRNAVDGDDTAETW